MKIIFTIFNNIIIKQSRRFYVLKNYFQKTYLKASIPFGTILHFQNRVKIVKGSMERIRSTTSELDFDDLALSLRHDECTTRDVIVNLSGLRSIVRSPVIRFRGQILREGPFSTRIPIKTPFITFLDVLVEDPPCREIDVEPRDRERFRSFSWTKLQA